MLEEQQSGAREKLVPGDKLHWTFWRGWIEDWRVNAWDIPLKEENRRMLDVNIQSTRKCGMPIFFEYLMQLIWACAITFAKFPLWRTLNNIHCFYLNDVNEICKLFGVSRASLILQSDKRPWPFSPAPSTETTWLCVVDKLVPLFSVPSGFHLPNKWSSCTHASRVF